jgi:hypothetical protein
VGNILNGDKARPSFESIHGDAVVRKLLFKCDQPQLDGLGEGPLHDRAGNVDRRQVDLVVRRDLEGGDFVAGKSLGDLAGRAWIDRQNGDLLGQAGDDKGDGLPVRSVFFHEVLVDVHMLLSVALNGQTSTKAIWVMPTSPSSWMSSHAVGGVKFSRSMLAGNSPRTVRTPLPNIASPMYKSAFRPNQTAF